MAGDEQGGRTGPIETALTEQGGNDAAQRMLGFDSEVLLTPEKEPRRRQVGCITPEAFAVGDVAMRSHLAEDGFAVVRAAVGPPQLAVLRDSLWQFLESTTGMQRGDASTWGGSFPGPSHLGMLSWAGIGQSDFMWHARTAEGVTASFEVAWGLEPGTPLFTSFDGCAFFRPPQLEPSWASQGALSWLHIDQGTLKPSLCGIQGALLLYDQTVSSGGLVLVPRSHRRHQRILDSVGRHSGADDFLPISADSPALEGLDDPALVLARAGDLLLWDSRTVHASAPASAAAPIPTDPDGTVRPSRAAAYVCMVPAATHLLDKPQLARERALAAMHWITTTHWPQDNRAVSQGRQPPRVGLDHLSATARALVLGLPRTAAGQAAVDAQVAADAAQAAADAAAAVGGWPSALRGGFVAAAAAGVAGPGSLSNDPMMMDMSLLGRNASTETMDAEPLGQAGSLAPGDPETSSARGLGLPPAADLFWGSSGRPVHVFTAPAFTGPTGFGAGDDAVGDAVVGASGKDRLGFGAESEPEGKASGLGVADASLGHLSDNSGGTRASSIWRTASARSVDMMDGAQVETGGGAALTAMGSIAARAETGRRGSGAGGEARDAWRTEGGEACDTYGGRGACDADGGQARNTDGEGSCDTEGGEACDTDGGDEACDTEGGEACDTGGAEVCGAETSDACDTEGSNGCDTDGAELYLATEMTD